MASLLKRELEEIKTAKEHMTYVPTASERVEDNFEELVMLFSRASSAHVLTGDAQMFTIVQKKFLNVMAGIGFVAMLFFVGMCFYSAAIDPGKPVKWLVAVGAAILIVVYLKWGKSTTGVYTGITVDRYRKTITVTNNHIIRKYFIAPQVLYFDEITGLRNELKTIKGKGHERSWQNIYAETQSKSIPILALPGGPMYWLNHDVFMTCLMRIIRAK